jgi:protein O-mannosyl-transferase
MLDRGSTHYSMTKAGAGLVLAGIVLFAASLNDPFHFDDVLILKDSNVTNAARWFHFFNPFHLRQLTFFTFYLNYLVGGESPLGFHLVNVALHIANAVLLCYLLRRYVNPWLAGVAAAIFLVHPVQTEAVLYVYQRSVLLACFFSLLALVALSRERYWLAALLFLCAFESKESAVAVPIGLALLHKQRARILFIGGGVIFGAAALALLFYQGEKTVGLGIVGEVSPWQYALAQLRVFYTYLRLLVWPHPQSLEYEFPMRAGIVGVTLQLAGVGLLIASAILALRRERWRLYGLAALAFLLLLAPSSSLVPSRDVAFEHRLYLPMLAAAVFFAALLDSVPRRSWIAGGVLCVLAGVAVARGAVWNSDVALWEDAVTKAPGKARAWFNLGGARRKTDRAGAREAFLKAIQLQPVFPEAYYNLGIIEQENGDANLGVVYFQKAIDQQPTYWPAWNNLGNAMFSLGQRERAAVAFERTLSLNPDYWPAQYNFAVLLFTTGKFEQAITRLRIVLDWKPDFREARYLLATALTQTGRRSDAEAQWKELQTGNRDFRAAPAMIPAPVQP